MPATTSAKKKRSQPKTTFWKAVFLASVLAGAAVLYQVYQQRPTDCDDAEHFYRGGLTPWSEVLLNTFTPVEPRPFIMQRHRPASILLAPKLYWHLAPSPTMYHVLIWLFGALSMLAFGWSTRVALEAGGIRLHPATSWVLASLAWWATPSLMYVSLGAVNTWIYALGHLAIGLLCKPPTRHWWLWILGCSICALLAFQSYEGNLFFFAWLGLWLLAASRLKTDKSDGARNYIVPLAVLAIYLVIFRSFFPGEKILSNQNPDGFILSLAPGVLLENFYYFVLVLFNGVALPLSSALRFLDVTPAAYPITALLTVTAYALAWHGFRKDNPDSKNRKRIYLAIACCLLMMLGSSAPHWAISNFHFVYFPKIASMFLMICFVLLTCSTKKLRPLPILLLISANAIAASQIVLDHNWNDDNAAVSINFYREVQNRPEFRSCTSEAPCCVSLSSRAWGHNEWVLNWLAGASTKPAFIPEGWPGLTCASHVRFD